MAKMYERGEEYWTYEKGQELLTDLNRRVREATGQDTGFKKALVNRSNVTGPKRQWNDETVGRSRREIMIYDAKNQNVDRAVQDIKLTQNFFPDPLVNDVIVLGYMKEGRHEEAVEYLREFGSDTNTRFDSPAFLSTYVSLCVSLITAGKVDKARELFKFVDTERLQTKQGAEAELATALFHYGRSGH